MAVKQSTKPSIPTKVTASKKSTTKKSTDAVVAAAPKGRAASKSTKATTVVSEKKPARTAKAVAPTVENLPTINSSSAQQSSELLPQMLIQQQAIQTQAWMTNEITQLRQQLLAAQKTPAPVAASAPNKEPELLAEIDRLKKENTDLREKAERLDQMTSFLQGTPVAAPVSSTVAKSAPKAPKVAKAPKAKATPVAKAPVKAAPVKTTVAATRKPRGGGSILQEAAIADVNRTYKSCWPIVFKIEEWNQKHPNQLAKVSQTMLNKSGVNFSRAKGFMENYGDLVESYHQQIGLSKANSGKFNEVYEFIRESLGKGKKV